MVVKYNFGNECLKRDLCSKWEAYEQFIHNQLLFSDKNTYLCLRPFASNKKIMIKICLYALFELTNNNKSKQFIFGQIRKILSESNYLNFEKYKSYAYLTAKYFSEQNIKAGFENSKFEDFKESTIENKINKKNEYFKYKIFKYKFRAEDLYYALAELKPIFVSCSYYSKKNSNNVFIGGTKVNYKLTIQGKKLLEMYNNGYLI